MGIKEKAKEFAIAAHKGQVRKSDKAKPMIIHPINVANILEEYGFDDNVIAAGYLHDVVEDTKYTQEDILQNFNEDVTSLVMGASEPDKSLSWEERKQHTIDTVKNLDLRHKAVVCADKISNLEDLRILFEVSGKRDFSNFNRGLEKQKWYKENVYQSLIYNEDENHPMFIRLKKLIDYIFNDNCDDEFIKNKIFENNKEEYQKLVNLHYKKEEIKKIKKVSNHKKPYVIEFTGTPRTGKTTLINNLKDFLQKGGFKVEILEEFTTSKRYKEEIYPRLKNEYKKVVNFEIPKYVLKDLENSLTKDVDFIIIDRSLFDRLIWVDRLYLKDGLTKKEYQDYLNTYIPHILEKINITIATYTDSITALKRDYQANLSLEKRSFLNKENIEEYNNSLINMKILAQKENINFNLFDTTVKTAREVSIEITNKILDDIKEKYIKIIQKEFNYQV